MGRHIFEFNKYMISIVVFWLLFVLIEFSFYRLAPRIFWGDYYGVEAVQEVYPIGEYPFFMFDKKYNRSFDILWKNSLTCTLPSWLKQASYYEWFGRVSPDNQLDIPRQYRGDIPNVKSDCLYKWNLYIQLPYGIERHIPTLTAPVRFE